MNTIPCTPVFTKKYSTKEEIANSITHGLGALLGVLSLILLLLKAEGIVRIVSSSVYGSSVIILFLASTFYHAIPYIKAKKVLKIVDHCAIYLLIAGSYTPFLLVTLKGTLGITYLVLIWSIAILGTVLKLIFPFKFRKLWLASYFFMGWIAVVPVYFIIKTFPLPGLLLIAVGGITYSLGVIFYVADKKIPYNHSIWHVFVLGGCLFHFLSIYLYVI